METPMTAFEFARIARQLADSAKRLGLCAPGFRSPPRIAGVNRSFRRRHEGNPTVSVRLSGRSVKNVTADMIEGILVVNDVHRIDRDRLRQLLASELEGRSLIEPAA